MGGGVGGGWKVFYFLGVGLVDAVKSFFNPEYVLFEWELLFRKRQRLTVWIIKINKKIKEIKNV